MLDTKLAGADINFTAARSAGGLNTDDLSSVMCEMRRALGGCAAILTSHSYCAHPPTIIYCDLKMSSEREDDILEVIGLFGSDAKNDVHGWRQCNGDPRNQLLLAPVASIAGHSRLIISIYFRDMTEEQRDRVEEAYLQQRPLAVGYFRLWQMNGSLGQRCAVLESALDQTDTGVIFLTKRGEPVFVNDAAENILSKGDGLKCKHGTVTATTMAESVSLQVALNHIEAINAQDRAVSSQSAPVLALHRALGPPLIISLLAANTKAIEEPDVAIIMYIVDPTSSTAKMLAPVCRLYQLSRVETDLVCHLAQGRALCQAAEAMHIKEQTARSYMKQIYLKTKTNRQTELVVLMLSSLVRMKESTIQEALSVSVHLNGRNSEF